MIFIGKVNDVRVYKSNNFKEKFNITSDVNNFIPKTATVSGISLVDETKRKSLVHKDKFKIMINDDSIPYGISFDQEWELLAYTENGFFNKHHDRQLNKNHKFTALLYPKSNHSGGELILEDDDSITIFESSKINNWTLVIFPISMNHESLPVKSGIKYVFKSPIFVDDEYNIIMKNDDNSLAD